MITSASDQSLFYMGKKLSNKFIILGEFEEMEQIEYVLRGLLSEGKISRLITSKDQENGEIKTMRVQTWGPVAFVSISTNPALNPENLSRCLILFAQ